MRIVPAARDNDPIARVVSLCPISCLGILADVPPGHHELIYANHNRGFALDSMRIPTRSHFNVQVPVDDDFASWPDERLWDGLALRLLQGADTILRGPARKKNPSCHCAVSCRNRCAKVSCSWPETRRISNRRQAPRALNLAASGVAYRFADQNNA